MTKRRWPHERLLQTFEHDVEGVGEFVELVVRSGESETLVQVLLTDPARRVRHRRHRPQRTPGDPPPHDRSEQGDQYQPDAGPQEHLLQRRALYGGHRPVDQLDGDAVGVGAVREGRLVPPGVVGLTGVVVPAGLATLNGPTGPTPETTSMSRTCWVVP